MDLIKAAPLTGNGEAAEADGDGETGDGDRRVGRESDAEQEHRFESESCGR